MPAERPLAIGLVRRPNGTPSADRPWGRALVVRHARNARLTLVDIYELDDDGARTADVLKRLADQTLSLAISVPVTDGVRPELAARLVGDLGLRHEPVPWRRRVDSAQG